MKGRFKLYVSAKNISETSAMKRNGPSKLPQHDTIVRVGPLTNLPAVLRSLRCDPEPVFWHAGFSVVAFADPDLRISFLAADNLLARCITVTGCGHLGLLLGEQATPSHLGIAGFQLATAPDVGSALHSLIRHLSLHDQSGSAELLTKGGVSSLGWTIHQTEVKSAEHIYDLSMVMACNIMRSLCGAHWEPARVLLSRQQPQDLQPYKRLFHAPVRFNANRNRVVFASRWLSHRLASSDPLLQQHLEQEANKLHQQLETGFVDQLHQLMDRELTSKQCSSTSLARQLNIHERTLHRWLKLFGTSFRHELEQVRYAKSRQLLSETNECIEHIGLSLGYANSSAFCRAFKQWSGITPSQWRAQVADTSGLKNRRPA